MRNKKRLTQVAAVLALSMVVAGTANAADVPVSAVVAAAGSGRVMTVTPSPITLVSVSGTSTMTATVIADVVEAPLTTGSPGWSVTTVLQGALTGSLGGTIGASNMTLSPSALTPTGLSTIVQTNSNVSMVMGGASQSLASAATLFTVNGEFATSTYAGTYHGVGTLTLTIPSGTTIGTYNSTMTVTLNQ
jgi:hypothetical protein